MTDIEMPDIEREVQLRELLDGALDRPATQRRAYLEEASDDAELRREVLELLAELDELDDFLEQPAIAMAGGPGTDTLEDLRPLATTYETGAETLLDLIEARPPERDSRQSAEAKGKEGHKPRRHSGHGRGAAGSTSERPSIHKIHDVVGPYRLLRPLGGGAPSRGVLGRVYRAIKVAGGRSSGRDVALRVAPTAGPLAVPTDYFTRNRRFLARLSHPHIAKVVDHGLVPDEGLTYLVSELVPDGAITTFCDQRRFDLATRLDLAEAVCVAIHHAHQKGVLHLDLRPSNILMTMLDGQPTAKVVDFGSMEDLDPNAPANPLHRPSSFGGLSYVAPEARRDPTGEGVDTRADIYALGMLLDELLIGTTSGQTSGFFALASKIRPGEVDRPSARFEILHESAALEQAKLRGTTPAELLHRLRGDLDAIIAKATHDTREQRYATVHELLGDLARYRQGEALRASTSRPWKSLGRLLERRRH